MATSGGKQPPFHTAWAQRTVRPQRPHWQSCPGPRRHTKCLEGRWNRQLGLRGQTPPVQSAPGPSQIAARSFLLLLPLPSLTPIQPRALTPIHRSPPALPSVPPSLPSSFVPQPPTFSHDDRQRTAQAPCPLRLRSYEQNVGGVEFGNTNCSQRPRSLPATPLPPTHPPIQWPFYLPPPSLSPYIPPICLLPTRRLLTRPPCPPPPFCCHIRRLASTTPLQME